MAGAVQDKTGRSYPWGFCAACGVPLERPGETICGPDCRRAYDRGKRPIGATGIQYEHIHQEAISQK